MTERNKKTEQANFDGFANALTNMGVANRDSSRHTTFQDNSNLSEQTMSEIYQAGGLGGKIIDLLPDSMTRKWITIPEDTDGIILKYLSDIKAKTKINSGLKWARLFGGAVVVMDIDDGQELDMPVNVEAIKSVNSLKVFDKRQITPIEWYDDSTVSKYKLNNLSDEESEFECHESRCLYFDGLELPDQERINNSGFGLAVLKRCWTQLRDLGTVYASTATITKEFNQGVLKVNGLNEMIASGRQSQVISRMEILQLSKSVINMLMIDGDREEFTELSKSVSGLPELIDRFKSALSSVTGYPETLLFGQSPAGMNATGESDAENYRGLVESEQVDRLEPELQKLINYIVLAKDCEYKDDWTIEFNPLYSVSEKEKAETRKIVAETDQMYKDMEALSPQTIALSRWGGESYSMEITLEEEDLIFDETELPEVVEDADKES